MSIIDSTSYLLPCMQMATGSPPHADLHPMRVLFLIPKEPAPTLEGAFSDGLKDFVSRCARGLLKKGLMTAQEEGISKNTK